MQRFLLRVSSALLLGVIAFPAHGQLSQIFGKKKSGKAPSTSNPLSGLDSKQPDNPASGRTKWHSRTAARTAA